MPATTSVKTVPHHRATVRWHRRLGGFACAALVFWSLSGAMHPLMSRYQPQPAQRQAPAVPALSPASPVLAEVLRRAGIDEVMDARLVQSASGLCWRVEPSDGSPARHFAARDGREIADGEARYAEFLARHFLGERSAVLESVARLEGFDREYNAVNRLLPVYCVRFAREDGMRVYVDTRHSMLATLVDNRKAMLNWVFSTFHNWGFVGSERLRVAVAGLFIVAVIATPLFGIALYVARRRHLPPGRWRRLHRALGVTVALLVLCSATSGAYHLLKSARDRAVTTPGPWRIAQRFPATALRTEPLSTWRDPVKSVSLIDIDGHPYARVSPLPPDTPNAAQHHGGSPTFATPSAHYLALDKDAPAMTDAGYARFLLDSFANRHGITVPPSAPLELVSGFGGEYGFINKLLPVYRMTEGTEGSRYYVHLDSRGLAARVTAADYAEGWTFANFHKWQALEALIGRWPRDLLQMGFALLSAAVALLGLRLLRTR